MKCSSSDQAGASRTSHRYFCEEPWTGIFSVRTDGDVICCPCYAQVKIGNINEASMEEIWNSDALLEMRRAFRDGELPSPCRGQICPVVVAGPDREGD